MTLSKTVCLPLDAHWQCIHLDIEMNNAFSLKQHHGKDGSKSRCTPIAYVRPLLPSYISPPLERGAFAPCIKYALPDTPKANHSESLVFTGFGNSPTPYYGVGLLNQALSGEGEHSGQPHPNCSDASSPLPNTRIDCTIATGILNTQSTCS